MEQNDDKTAGEVLNAADQSQTETSHDVEFIVFKDNDVKLDDESSLLTTFQACFVRYRWCHLPFGTTVSSEVFQKHLLEALRGLPGIICIADDIVIYGKTSEEHDENLRKFFERCLETGIKLNKDKLDVGLKEVTFMGHRITKEGLRVDPAKVSAISEMQPPTNINEFADSWAWRTTWRGSCLTCTMQPLHNLLKNDVPYVWSKTQQTSFDAVKVMLFLRSTTRTRNSSWRTIRVTRTGIGFATRWQASGIRKPTSVFS